MSVHLCATYRVQFSPAFTFEDGAELVGYLHDLGISHLYASPIFQATPGSSHGYDIVDPARLNEDLGGHHGHQKLIQALQAKDMGQVLDVVPNHMSINSPLNRWWWDVLENGPSSRFATHFDVDWEASEASPNNRILLPVLGDHYGRVLEDGQLLIVRRQDQFLVCYFDHELPLAPRSLVHILQKVAQRLNSDELTFFVDCLHNLPLPTVTDRKNRKRRHRNKEVIRGYLFDLIKSDPKVGETIDAVIAEINKDPDMLDSLLERQNYRLSFWRTAGRDIGYRRFFDINTLAALCVEDEEVFADAHALVLRWLNENWLHGLRIDHPDGLRDPEQYFRRLRQYNAETWIVAEKILHPGEKLRSSWPIQGTTGYEFLNLVTNVLIHPGAEQQLTDFYAAFTGEPTEYPSLLTAKKRLILHGLFGSDVHRLSELLRSICLKTRRYRDYTLPELETAVAEILVCTPLYRTYIRADTGYVDPEDRQLVQQIIATAKANQPQVDPALFDWLQKILLLEQTGDLESEFVMHLQQLSPPVMAKGAEDTAFYCYNRFVALNEVGGDPADFGLSVPDFHQAMQDRMQTTPTGMSTTSTHDTKRSEDVRARLAVLSEIPELWAKTVRRWAAGNEQYKDEGLPERNMEYLIYQSMLGAWPIDEERMQAFVQKAAREAKTHTAWTRVREDYERALHAFVRALYRDSDFLNALQELVDTILAAGRHNALAQTLLKLTCPGVPDLYQGCELWDLSLVDPDNRRPVDYKLRRRLLAELDHLSLPEIMAGMEQGLPKLWLIRQALQVRRDFASAFGPAGQYTPLTISGAKADHALAFDRSQQVLCIVPRLPYTLNADWKDTEIHLPPGDWHNMLTRERISAGSRPLADLLAAFPVALLTRVE